MRICSAVAMAVLVGGLAGCRPGALADSSLKPKPPPPAAKAQPEAQAVEPEQAVAQDLGSQPPPEEAAPPPAEEDATALAFTNGHVLFAAANGGSQTDPFVGEAPQTPRRKPGPIREEHRTVRVADRSFSVQVVRVPLAGYEVRVASAKNRVGPTESLGTMAKRNHGVAAINGCFFDAYLSAEPRLPFHTMMHAGSIEHVGKLHDTVLGFDGEGGFRMDTVRFLIRGELSDDSGRKASWWAYRLNHPGGATLYSREWYAAKTPASGTQVVVRNGVVESIADGARDIPSDGYVLAFDGGDREMAQRFWQGAKCSARIDIEAEDRDFWTHAKEAIGCGPRLVIKGSVHVDPAAEEFTHPKILTLACSRSAVGVTEDGTLLMVTCGAVTLRDLGMVMKKLGAYEAMNLDGGGSSALWLKGRYLTGPGRDISNALVVVPR
jgi:hypothetical protein